MESYNFILKSHLYKTQINYNEEPARYSILFNNLTLVPSGDDSDDLSFYALCVLQRIL